jgi:hypothetical protein
VGLEEQ